MSARPISVRIPEETRAAIDEMARQARRDFSSVVNEMLNEAVKMRRVRGILFADELQRREAKISGTGLGVWEVIAGYQRLGQDWEQFREAYDWLSEFQLRAALAYWEAYTEEIDEMIRQSQSWTQEKIWATYPVTRPPEARAPEGSEEHVRA